MDGFDATSQRYVLRVFTGQPGAKPKIVAWKMKDFWVILEVSVIYDMYNIYIDIIFIIYIHIYYIHEFLYIYCR